MGKRGPAAKGEFGDKSAVLSTRISADLRAALESSVKKNGLTLSREIEHRLRRTFIEDEKIDEGFGSRRNRALMKMIAMMMQTAQRPDKRDVDWLDDSFLFERAVGRLNALFELVKPMEGSEHPSVARPEVDSIMDRVITAGLLYAVQRADPKLPLNERELVNLLKSDLGEVAMRRPVRWSTDEEENRLLEEKYDHGRKQRRSSRIIKNKEQK
jgi:hypothetical protein